MITIILDEHDANALLRILYNGTRPGRVHTLICSCGAIADLRVSACAWNGWQLLPHARCPRCVELGPSVDMAERNPAGARERFFQLVEKLGKEG